MDVNRQRAQCIQGKISLMSSESINSIVEAEPLGFAISCSSGRVAHLTIGDVSNKAPLSTEFLQSSSTSSGGYFGSLSSLLLGSGPSREIAALKPGSTWQRGQRQVILATADCKFEVWDFHWNKTQSLLYHVDARAEIMKALQEGGDTFYNESSRDLRILDFTFRTAGTSKDLVQVKDKGACDILILTSLERQGVAKYNLVGLTMSNGMVDIRVVHPISCYTTPESKETSFRPKVLIPEPGHTAFVAFQKSVAMISLAEIPLSADSQLMAEANALEPPFQDVLDFRRDRNYSVVGCVNEASDKHHEKASCILAIYDYGLVRVTALPLKRGQDPRDRARITARTKLEQAVFYGSLDQNLFDFSRRSEIVFNTEEVDKAARDISLSICKSTSEYLPKVTTSTEIQLQRRSDLLSDLIKNLRKHYPPLPPLTRMTLLQNAERMVSAKAMFKTYSKYVGKSPGEPTVLSEAVEMLGQEFKKENQPDSGETDNVRHWLIHDVWRLERLTPWLGKTVHVLQKEAVEDEAPWNAATKVRMYTEAIEETLAVIETAFQFREQHLALYGFGKEKQVDGVLSPAYDMELPFFWTSTNLEKFKELADGAMNLAQEEFDRNQDETQQNQAEADMADPEDTKALIDLLPRYVQICIQAWLERLHMYMSKRDQIKDAEKVIRKMSDEAKQIQLELTTKLPLLGIGIKGVQLAEKYRNMPALVEIINTEKAEQFAVLNQHGTSKEEQEFANTCLGILDGKIKDYFISFGEPFADAYFDEQFSQGRVGETLTTSQPWQKYLTDYLRRHGKRYDKITWMNEIMAEGNYSYAGKILKSMQEKEPNSWSMKIQSSLSKLSFLAAVESKQIPSGKAAYEISSLDSTHSIRKYASYLQEYVNLITEGAIDDLAAKDLAYRCLGGGKATKGKLVLDGKLHSVLDDVVEHKLVDAYDLIDALTLMGVPADDTMKSMASSQAKRRKGRAQEEDPYPLPSSRFYLALLIAHAVAASSNPSNTSHSDAASFSLTEILIWRRCFLADDWPKLNRTETKSDQEVQASLFGTALYQTLYLGFREGFWERKGRPLGVEEVLKRGGGGTLSSSSSSSSLKKNQADKEVEDEDNEDGRGGGIGMNVDFLKQFPRYQPIHSNVLEGLIQDFQAEDTELRKFVEHGRIGVWFEGCMDAAKGEVRREREERLRKVAGETEGNGWRLVGAGGEAGNEVVVGNGNGNGDTDGDGDVLMEGG